MHINFKKNLMDELIHLCTTALPKKAYGIVAGENNTATKIYPLHTNLRLTEPRINAIFESYGEFYKNKDRGFWIDAKEQFKVFNEIKKSGQEVIAIYHSHRCLCATPSQVDIDLHHNPKVATIIVSVIKPDLPEVKAFKIANNLYKEIRINII